MGPSLEVAASLRTTAAEIRARLVMLGSVRLIAGRQDKADGKPRRVYFVKGEGRRKAGISDARTMTL